MLPNNGAQSTPGLIAGLLNSLIDKVESGKINQCKYCHKSFSRKNDLKRHIDSHLQTKNFGCTDCDYRCVQKHALVSHMQRKHLNPIPKSASYSVGRHRCQFCSYASKNITNLTIHERVHLRLKPYSCPDCTYRTAYKYNLAKHARNGTHYMVRPAKRQRLQKL